MTQFINTQRGSKGEPGERGLPGASINSAAFDGNDIVYGLTDGSSVRLVDGKTELTGPQGEPGEPGKDGEPGQDGAAATISVGTTTTGNPGTNASVTNSGTSSAAVFNFTIPRGADGADGQDGAAATITAGTATGLPAGSSPTVTNSGSSSAAVFNFGIPAGATGATGNGISSVTTSKSGKVTTVTMNYTDGSTPTSFQVSDGQDGEGSGDVIGPSSSTNGNVALFDGTTGKLIKDSGKAFTAAGIGALPDSTKYGATLDLSVDTTTYIVTATLKDQDGTTLSSDTIDLPLESVVVGGSYDSATKKVILTLENGNTVEFSVADLVSGLQTEITSSNKLDADLVDDSTSTNKFVTAANKTTWNGKQDALIAGTNIQIAADGKTISATDTTYSDATQSTAGLMSSTDKAKLDGIASGAQVNSITGVKGNAESTYRTGNVNITPANIGIATQTAYTSKGTSTKVPTISTNTLGQVTAITETSISFPVSSVNGSTGAVTVQETLVSGTNIKTINGTSVLGSGDITVSGGTDYSWVTKTISGGEVELGLRTIVNAPGENFTLTAPATLQDGEEYVIRVINEANYTMTLGTGFTNPFSVDLSLSSYATDQFVFVAVGGNLELQPLFNN